MTQVALNNLWSYLQGLMLSQSDRAWLMSKLIEAAEADGKTNVSAFVGALADAEEKQLDAALAKFHKDWGGEGSAMEIAEELRGSRGNSRTVETW